MEILGCAETSKSTFWSSLTQSSERHTSQPISFFGLYSSGSDFIAAPYGAAEIGGLYYLTENPSYYAANRFYIMTYDEDGGFYYLQTFGTATPLLGTDENGTSNAYLRLKNGRLYLTTGSDYSGTGGTDIVELEAVIRVDGTEYRRIFRITVIG